MLDKTVMEKPPREDKNFSIVVPYSTYITLRKASVIAGTSLGEVCRQLLGSVNVQLYSKLHSIACTKMNGGPYHPRRVPMSQTIKELLEESMRKDTKHIPE